MDLVDLMDLFIFARFHAIQGQEAAVASELRDAVNRSSAEPGCLSIAAYHGVRDPRLFWIHSHWIVVLAQRASMPLIWAFTTGLGSTMVTCSSAIFPSLHAAAAAP